MSLKIGVDFGGVLSIHDRGNPDGAEHKSTAINMPHAVESLRQLKEAGHKLCLNSFCGRNRAIETKAAIDKEIPGLFDEIYFVKSKKFKGAITKYAGCDVMIDDRLDILINICNTKTCPNPVWFKGDPTLKDDRKAPNNTNIIEMYSWKDIMTICCNIKPSAVADPTIDVSSMIHMV